MELTKEQIDIINSTGDIKINAVAGSGKTTTIIEYARTRPVTSRILYLAFNKSVKLEAARKFADKGLSNVKVETAHSLAYKHIVFQNNYKVRANGYKTNEIAELLNLQGNGEKHAEYIVANHISKFIAYFCNSDKLKVQDLNYLDLVTDVHAKTFVRSFYPYIEKQTRILLAKMDKGEIEITHDFYLKKFQLINPQLPYDYILFDEGQDASAAMLDIFFNQNATKVIVGDTHQQIYGWRFAVNSLEKANFKTYHLSTSFRFSQDIANLAMEVLSMKEHISEYKAIPITGKGVNKEVKTKAVLGRSNLGLLLKSIEYVREKKQVKHLYFEGNFSSYTYADEGASLYDVLNLFNSKRHLIKDNLIKAMKDMDELEDYIEKTEDMQLGMMVKIVKEYENEIPDLIKAIKDKHVSNEEKDKAEMIFSTVHRCKGLEYDAIHLCEDFITEERLIRQLEDDEDGTGDAKLNEEINLLYVAITRTKKDLHIPETLLPKGFPASKQIFPIKIIAEKDKVKVPPAASFKQIKKTGYVKEKPMTYGSSKTKSYESGKPKSFNGSKTKATGTSNMQSKSSFAPWTKSMDEDLTNMYIQDADLNQMAKHLKRTTGAIALRIKKLQLVETYG